MSKKLASKEDLQELFALFDEEGDGKIDGSQIGYVCRAFGAKPTQEIIKKVIDKEYKPGEKRVTFDEVYPYYEKLISEQKDIGTAQDYIEALKTLDKGGHGRVNSSDIKLMLMSLGDRLTLQEAEEIMFGHEDAEGLVNVDVFIRDVMSMEAVEK